MSEWAEGNYAAVTKAATVYPKNGKEILGISFDVGGTEMKSYTVIVEPDGTVNTKNCEKLREWSGWDGIDPYWFIEAAKTGIECEVGIEMELYKEKLYPKIKWVNKAGGSGGGFQTCGDHKAFLAKHGSKFRACAGPQSVATSPRHTPVKFTPAPTGTPPARPSPTMPPSGGVRHTNASCWEALGAANPTMPQRELTELWFKLIGDRDQSTMSPSDWAGIAQAIEGMSAINGGPSDDDKLPF